MKLLHIASFHGNIGDNANHSGLRRLLSQHFGDGLEFSELEIRKCYQIYTGQDRWTFNEEFVRLANLHDLVLIGGGNFFEPWLEGSATGTTIDLAPALMKKIKTPLVFYGVGFDLNKGYSDETLSRFSHFAEESFNLENVYLSVRNDGSMKNLQKVYPESIWGKISVVPDGGFFYRPKEASAIKLELGQCYWGINIASDMLDLRFNSERFGWEDFVAEFAKYLEEKLQGDPGLSLILFPHIFKDLEAISGLLQSIDDRFCRDRIVVAPYLSGCSGADQVFSLYDKCDLIMGMRFHTNVCAMALNRPAIGLASYPKLEALYQELGYKERAIKVNQPGFTDEIEAIIKKSEYHENLISENEEMLSRLERKAGEFLEKLKINVI